MAHHYHPNNHPYPPQPQQPPQYQHYTHHHSPAPSLRTNPSHLSRRPNTGCELHPQPPQQPQPPPPQYYQQHESLNNVARADYYDTTECETEDDNERTKTRVIRYQKRNFKYPIVTDPKLMANHLAWNRSSRSAECLDESLTIEETLTAAAANSANHLRPTAISPVARAISPGFALIQQQQQSQPQSQPAQPNRSRSYTTTMTQHVGGGVSGLPYMMPDSAYNTQSSNEDSSDSRQTGGCGGNTGCGGGGGSHGGHEGHGGHCCKGCADAAANSASSNNRPVYDRIRQQQQQGNQQFEAEQDETNRTTKKTNSHKVEFFLANIFWEKKCKK